MNNPTSTRRIHPLPRTIVGIDVETTSLDPAEGDIIEVAAIRYQIDSKDGKLGKEVDSLTLLAAPRQPLTDQIIAITGITNEMVKETRHFKAIVSQVQAFIGDDLLFAHNANFDVSYLTNHGLAITQPVWDTFALAGAAWPAAPSYNLGSLAQQLGIEVNGEHRAGSDVRLTWQLLQKIYQQLQLPPDQHAVVVKLLKESKQRHYIPLFRTAAKEQAAGGQPGAPHAPELLHRGVGVQAGQDPRQTDGNASAGSAGDEDPLIDHSTLTAILGPDGLLEHELPGFKARQQQIDMANIVDTYLEQGGVGLIEAGTGTGKTYGYLVPLLLNIQKAKRGAASPAGGGGVVSTHTKSLQDQLMQDDLPRLLAALGSAATVSTLKGRRNYLCTSRLAQALARPVPRPADAWLLIKLLCWLQGDDSGDLEHLNISHQDARLLRHLHADSISCRQVCAVQNPSCPYQRARRTARAADLLIVNHALLIQIADDETLPLTHLVIDEAHHLAPAAREATRRELSEQRLAEVIAPISQLAQGEGQLQPRIRDEAGQLLQEYQRLLKELSAFMERHAGAETLRLTGTVRRSAAWQKIRHHADAWESKLAFTLGLLQSIPAVEKQQKLLQEAVRAGELARDEVNQFIRGNPERIQWLESAKHSGQQTIILHDVALSVASELARVYQRARSCILTSATLTVSGNFSYIKKRIGKEDAADHRLDSPFNIRDNLLIYIIEDSLETAEQRYDQYIADMLYEASRLAGGRTLGLFTSHALVKTIYFKLVKKLNEEQMRIFAQRITGGRHTIIRKFRQDPASVLLGTYSFWEGLDVPGDGLSIVVIPKLPFTPPRDPVIAAIAEAEGLSAFQHLALPDMLLRLRQGIGRLLRTTSDRGVVILGDARILRREYGQQVLNSLPAATVKIGPRREMAAALADWFGEATINQWQTLIKNRR